ncbi:MAG TPA: hypothetical protein VNH65_16785 [Candidatus Acidoferrum sp.]|nr:hypothetical protein [Candidatus Acidoferrum sp.]
MDEYGFDSRGRPQKRKAQGNPDNKIQSLLNTEEQLLQQISSRAPVPGVLNGICIALDCQIGNVVSLISLSEDRAGELGAIATNAALFGLFTFCSEGIVTEDDELLGTLEMYCSDRRSPSAAESQLIERAKCLAAIAIKFDKAPDLRSSFVIPRNRPVRAPVLQWPVSFN